MLYELSDHLPRKCTLGIEFEGVSVRLTVIGERRGRPCTIYMNKDDFKQFIEKGNLELRKADANDS